MRTPATLSPHLAYAVPLVLFSAFFLLYFALGSILAPLENVFDFFGADMWEDPDRDGEIRHLLVPLFLEPVFLVARQVSMATHTQAAAINAAFGALAVALSYRVFLLLVGFARQAVLLSLFYGVSMSQLLFAAIPETYAIGATGITGTYLVFLVSLSAKRMRFLHWFGVGLWTIGITTSNVAQTTVAYAAAAHETDSPRRALRGMMLVGALLLTVAILLQVQARIFDGRSPLSTEAVRDEFHAFLGYVERPSLNPGGKGVPDSPQGDGRSVKLLAVNYLLLGFVGARPGRTPVEDHVTKLEYFGHPLQFQPLGLAALALWLALWVAGLMANVRSAMAGARWPPPAFFAALGIILVGNMMLFMIYNPREMYLYSLLTTFPILLLGVNGALICRPGWTALLTGLVLLTALNNVDIATAMVAQGAAP